MDSYKFHHSALARGYVRVGHEVKEPYNGKFGRGYKLYKNNPCSSRYCIVEYYIRDGQKRDHLQRGRGLIIARSYCNSAG